MGKKKAEVTAASLVKAQKSQRHRSDEGQHQQSLI